VGEDDIACGSTVGEYLVFCYGGFETTGMLSKSSKSLDNHAGKDENGKGCD
jgi:hypothetical protein